MLTSLVADVIAVQSIEVVPTILETVAAITGLRFVCVARVTSDSWTTCAVLDKLDFGLKPGDELDVSTTLCEEVRNTNQAIIIDHVSHDPKYCDHHTPKIYGFESYISVPILRKNGEYFGTLCGLDPLPLHLTNTATINSMKMFAELISLQLSSEAELSDTQDALLDARETAELREQFIAVLGHDIRSPLSAILMAAQLLGGMPTVGEKATAMVKLIDNSAKRILRLVDDVVDFTRGKMGGGIGVEIRQVNNISEILQQVISELAIDYPQRNIVADIDANISLLCDEGRIGQLLSNLLKNALVHGDPQQPVRISAKSDNGIFKLAVSNGGPKLSRDTIQQLFKPYWRGALSSTKEGLGLGLFIVSEIARSHAGKINVLSSDEVTSFIFSVKDASFVERRKSEASKINFIERRENV